jgi:hypothetical protein
MNGPEVDALPKNVFMSLQDFFDPDQHDPSPLVLLPPLLNPFPPEERVMIFAKLMYLSPTLNLKWAPAYEMLRRALEVGGSNSAHREYGSGLGFAE